MAGHEEVQGERRWSVVNLDLWMWGGNLSCEWYQGWWSAAQHLAKDECQHLRLRDLDIVTGINLGHTPSTLQGMG